MKADVLLTLSPYSGVFRKRDKLGRWRKVGSIGNAGIAIDFLEILKRLGHKVELNEIDPDWDY